MADTADRAGAAPEKPAPCRTRCRCSRRSASPSSIGDFVANDDINLEIWPAEVHALLGENGAGKSTLVKMIYGLLQPTRGEFNWQGEPVALAGPAAARARGIGMVFQHFSLFEQLTVAENVALGLDNAPLAGIERAGRRGVEVLRPAARSEARGVAALGRRAAAHRDRALPAAGPEAADPRRADLGAHPAGGRAAVPHACACCARKAAPSSTSATSSRRCARCATPPRSCAAARSSRPAIRAPKPRSRSPA